MAEQTTLIDPPRAKKAAPLTESQLVELLRPRYQGENGNGPAGCVVAQVRNQAGFDASRTIDALGFHFWPSRGLLIDGFECKSSRSDWVRELEDPAKADAFCRLVKVGEMPPEWGLLAPQGGKLRELKPAIVLHQDSPAIDEWAKRAGRGRRAAGPRPLPPGFDRSFLVAIIRQAYKLTGVEPAELQTARNDAYAAGARDGERSAERELERLRKRDEDALAFEQALGYPIKGYRSYLGGGDIKPADIGRTLRVLLDGDAEVTGLRNRLSAAVEGAERLAQEGRSRLGALDAALVRTGSPASGEATR